MDDFASRGTMIEFRRTLGEIDVIVLAGGKGTRARAYLQNTQKFLAPIPVGANHFPLGRLLLEYLRGQGVRRVILALANGAPEIIKAVKTWRRILDIVPLAESEAAGTCAALRNIATFTTLSDPYLVINGDTLLGIDLGCALARYRGSPMPIHGNSLVDFEKDHETFSHCGATFMPRDWHRLAASNARNVEDIIGTALPYLSSGLYLDLGTPEGWALRHSHEVVRAL